MTTFTHSQSSSRRTPQSPLDVPSAFPLPPTNTVVTCFSSLPSLFFIPLGVAFGIKSHLGKSQTAATKPNSTGGRLITQLINPADVIVSAHFFVIWMRTSYIAEIGFELVAKCLFF